MELRVLRYFLTVAREQNITRAAEVLHITQPTLSRQLKQLEEELETTLFVRGKSKVTLTEGGVLLRRRAEDLIELADKTEKEFLTHDEFMAGDLFIGAGETKSMHILAKAISQLHDQYPQIHYHVHSGNADDIKEKIDNGLLDIGLLTEPVDIEKYDFIRLNEKETWGLLMRKDHPLAKLESITPYDLRNVQLWISRRCIVQNEITHWMSEKNEKLNILGTYNLIQNAAVMVEEGIGCAICLERLTYAYNHHSLCFRPFSPLLQTGTVIVWKKHQVFSQVTLKFLEMIRKNLKET